MKKSEMRLRQFIRMMIGEGAVGPGVTADPKPGGGARDYEIERGNDIHGYWYRSPGDKGDGDPGRPDDAEEYIGMKPKTGGEETTTPAAASEGVKRRRQGL